MSEGVIGNPEGAQTPQIVKETPEQPHSKGIFDRVRSIWPSGAPKSRTPEGQAFAADAALNLPSSLHANDPMPGEGATLHPGDAEDMAAHEAKFQGVRTIPLAANEQSPGDGKTEGLEPGEGPSDPAILAADMKLMAERQVVKDSQSESARIAILAEKGLPNNAPPLEQAQPTATPTEPGNNS